MINALDPEEGHDLRGFFPNTYYSLRKLVTMQETTVKQLHEDCDMGMSVYFCLPRLDLATCLVRFYTRAIFRFKST